MNALLYVLTDDGRIERTGDLQHWETVVTSDNAWITIEYWEERNWLVLGGIGASTGLWKIDLAPPPPT